MPRFVERRGPRYIRGQLAIQHARQRQKLNEEHQLTKRRGRRIMIPSDLNTPAGCLHAQRLSRYPLFRLTHLVDNPSECLLIIRSRLHQPHSCNCFLEDKISRSGCGGEYRLSLYSGRDVRELTPS